MRSDPDQDKNYRPELKLKVTNNSISCELVKPDDNDDRDNRAVNELKKCEEKIRDLLSETRKKRHNIQKQERYATKKKNRVRQEDLLNDAVALGLSSDSDMASTRSGRKRNDLQGNAGLTALNSPDHNPNTGEPTNKQPRIQTPSA